MDRFIEIAFVITMVLAAAWLIGNVIAGIPPTGPDAMDHMQWITQFTQQVDSGIWYPRWLAQSFGGFGLPIFYIYPPLAYYAAWFVHLFNHTWPAETLWRIVTTGSLLASAATGYLYFRTVTPRRSRALIATLIYIGLPYRYWDVLVRCAYSESLVFVFLPLLFLAVDRVFKIDPNRQGALRNVAAIALLTALLIFTSAPTVALLSIGVPFYGLMKWRSTKPDVRPILLQLGAGAVLGLCCSAFWLLPAFHFRSLVQTDLAYDPGFARMYDLIAIFVVNRSNLLFVPMLMALIALVAMPVFLLQRARLNASVEPWLALGLLIVLLQLPISWPLWTTIPMLRVVQFSARWGILLSMVLPVAYLAMRPSRSRTILLLSTAVLTVLSIMHAYPTLVSSWTFKGYDNSRPPQMDAFEYLPNTVEKGGWPTHVLGLQRSAPEVTIDSNAATIDYVVRRATSTTLGVTARTPVSVTIARFYWPGWKLHRIVHGEQIASDTLTIEPTHNGFIRAQLPSGHTDLSLELERTEYEKIGALLSLASFAVSLSLIAISLRRSNARK